jgi:hypothetical protein
LSWHGNTERPSDRRCKLSSFSRHSCAKSRACCIVALIHCYHSRVYCLFAQTTVTARLAHYSFFCINRLRECVSISVCARCQRRVLCVRVLQLAARQLAFTIIICIQMCHVDCARSLALSQTIEQPPVLQRCHETLIFLRQRECIEIIVPLAEEKWLLRCDYCVFIFYVRRAAALIDFKLVSSQTSHSSTHNNNVALCCFASHSIASKHYTS